MTYAAPIDRITPGSSFFIVLPDRDATPLDPTLVPVPEINVHRIAMGID
jgi:hypothetical protein